MTTISIQEAQERLADLIHRLGPGEEVVIIEDNQPIARLVAENPQVRRRPGPGLCKGMITIVADDEEHLDHFREYIP